MNIAQHVERGAQLYPDRLALSFEAETFSYHQLNVESNRAANSFAKLGVNRGDRVALWLPNTAAFVVAYLGLQKCGAIAVTINTALKAEELHFILKDSGAQVLLTTASLYTELAGSEGPPMRHIVLIEGACKGAWSLAGLLKEASADYVTVTTAPADPAALLYTSGTTGFPKGALLSHQTVVVAAQTAVATFDLRPADRVLLSLSLFHSFAQTAALHPCFEAGATLILHRQFEVEAILRSLQEQAATFFFGVPTLYILLQAQATPAQLHSVRRYISAGASLPVEVARRWQAMCGTAINEGYGLTEICLGTFNHEPLAKPGSVGKALAGVRLGIVNGAGEQVSPGELGEVLIQTPSVMLGYWNRPTETAAVLRDGWFHTGDIGRVDEDGYYYIIDRIKDMVNVGGAKVYPSEVENVLYQHPAVTEAAVYGVPEPLLGEQVQATIVLKPDHAVTPQELIAFCRQRLAEFKAPSGIDFVTQLPKSRTGKILKRILREQRQATLSTPQPNGEHTPSASGQIALHGATQTHAETAALAHWIATWLADQIQGAVGPLAWDQPFAEYGMTSIMAVNLAQALGERLGRPLQALLLWNFPTIDTLVHHLLGEASPPLDAAPHAPADPTNTPPNRLTPSTLTEPIALIGIGCRFPGGANTPEQFWQLLRNGVDTVRPIPATRWNVDDYYDPTPNTPGKMYVRTGHFLEGIDHFDASFFGITPLEAAAMDPQQRLLLEVCWEALEHANLAADQLRESRTGVYVGAFWDDYSALHLYNADPDQIDSYRLLSNLRGMTAGRLAYVLGLHGPVMQLDTACSSSLLAVHLACQALRIGECELALAGGVNLVLAPEQLIGLCHMGAVAPDGRCKTFAADADGFGVGEGVGVVVLKRVADALRDGDPILAVIRGSAVTHDGASNGLTAPNGRAQEAMLRLALADAAVQPAQIQYVETHGTGTVLGDPIEVQALSNVLGQARRNPLLLGSVKTNIGHLSAAAGVAALIKVALALDAGEIPPSLHFTTPNPYIPWESTRLAVPTTPMAWPPAVANPVAPTSARRLAGVSSFGLTGTNVHLIVEEAPHRAPKAPAVPVHLHRNGHGAGHPLHRNGHNGTGTTPPSVGGERPYHLLTLSAKNEPALDAQIDQYAVRVATLLAHGDDPRAWADLCYTAATSRSHWGTRLSIVAPDLATARTKLRQARVESTTAGIQRSKKGDTAPKIAFLFPGQGPQYVDMGRQLYETQPRFRRTLQECAEILPAYLDQPLLEILYGADQARADALLNEATYAQPALFAIEYALATLWRSWGIEPTVVLGHSLGEYAAACLAGVFSLEDGLKLVAARGRLMQVEAPQGRMVAVLGHAAAVRAIIAPYAAEVSLAAINTPQSVVIAGNPRAIAAAEQALQRAGLETRSLKIYVASHSPLMAPILAQFAAVARSVTYHAPRLPVVSNLTGTVADEALTTPDYWCRHLREPVQFAQGMATIAGLGIDTLIEAGPKATLLGLAQQCLPVDETRLYLPTLHPKRDDWSQLLESLATLYGRGAAIDWQGFDQEYPRTKVSLPRYPFQRQRYWLDATPVVHRPVSPATVSAPPQAGAHPLLGRAVRSALAARNRELLFENRFDLVTLPYLADHALFDQPLVPGAAYIEMILAAGAQLWPQAPLALGECSIQQGLFLPAAELAGATVQVVLTPAEVGYLWQIYSLADGAQPAAPWTLHAAGKVAPAQSQGQPVPVDLAAVRARCYTALDLTTFDQQLRDQGITYGPAFQALTHLWVGEGEALGYVTLPQTLVATAGAYQLHPVLLDAALRVASSLLPDADANPYLPFGVEQVRLFSQSEQTVGQTLAQTRLWSHVRRSAEATSTPGNIPGNTPGNYEVDITLLDEEGQVIAIFTKFTLRRANRQTLLGSQRRLDWLYELTWKPVPRSPQPVSTFDQPGRWVILADRQGCGAALAARLAAQGEQCSLCYNDGGATAELAGDAFLRLLQAEGQSKPSKLRGVVYLWGIDTLDCAGTEVPVAALQVCTQALQLVQGILQSGQSPRLWIVTQQAIAAGTPVVQVQQAPLWGLARTLQAEQPELACTCIDLTSAVDLDALFAELCAADQENQILLRGEERLVARLTRHREQATRTLVLDRTGSYLVTGGLGGLGLQVAQWLVAQGARHLVLAGRRGATTPAAQAALATMEANGAQISVLQADIADHADVRRLLAYCQATAPLCGIIHAAGVIDDGLLFQQTPARFAQVMAPKVAGTWHLHTLTRDLPLDFFVCFSSVAALLGNGGQGNYAAANAFMDALAQQRHNEGKPALSINWGGWSEVGLAADLVQQTAAAGLGAITPAQGVDLLGLLMTHQAPQVGVLPIDWRKFQQTQAGKALTLLLADLTEPATAPNSSASLRQQLTAASPSARHARLKEYVQTVVTTLLGTTPGEEENFLLFGLDSLLSIQLANRLAATLGLALPATLAFTYGTIAQVTQFLDNMLSSPTDAADAATAKQSARTAFTDWYPQLYNQQECFVWHEEVENKACLHVQQAVYIHSPVAVHLLATALQLLVERHEALRTVYLRRGADLLQRTLATQTVDFTVIDGVNQPWPAMADTILAAAREPFDLVQGPLLRGRLYSRAADDHLFLLVVHHIAADATALSVIINELWAIYGALQRGSHQPLPPVSTDWSSFVRWQTDQLQGAKGEQLGRYWQQQLAGDLPRLQLPTDYPPPERDSHQGRPCTFELDAVLIQHLRQLAQHEECTLYMVLMATFQLLLYRYTAQRDLIVAAHVANRNEAAFAEVVGYLADTFPIRAQIPADATFQTLLHQVQRTILGAMEQQGFPMRLLAEHLQVQEHPSRPTLCQVWFTLLPLRLFQESGALFQAGTGVINLGGLALEAADLLPAWLGAWYDLEMILTEGESTVFGTLVYKTDLFAEATVLRMIADFQTLLKMIVANPTLPIDEEDYYSKRNASIGSSWVARMAG